eukprot:3621398-Rhodomonas_salina.2
MRCQVGRAERHLGWAEPDRNAESQDMMLEACRCAVGPAAWTEGRSESICTETRNAVKTARHVRDRHATVKALCVLAVVARCWK